jgi:hypothetical protein
MDPNLVILARAAGLAGQTWNAWTGSDEVQDLINACGRLDIHAIEVAFAEGAREHRIAGGWRIMWTTAPADYDGFGTETIEDCGRYCGKALRRILVDPDYVNYQTSRNGSGLHPTWDDDPRVAEAKAKEAHDRRIADDAARQAKHAEGLVWLQTASDNDLEDFDVFEARGLRYADVKAEKERRIDAGAEKARVAEWARCLAVIVEGSTLIDVGRPSVRGQYGVIPGCPPHVYYNVTIVRSWPDEVDRANVIGQGNENAGSASLVADWLISGRLRVARPGEVPPYAVLKRIGQEHLRSIRRVTAEGRTVWVGRPTFGETLVLDEKGHIVRSKKILASV